MLENIAGIIIPGIIISIFTSIITVRLSLRQFRSQKWWELQREAYSKIIEELSLLQIHYARWFEESVGIVNLNEEERAKLHIYYRNANECISKVSAMGAFIISQDTVDILIKLSKELEDQEYSMNTGDWASAFDNSYGLVKEAISKIRELAKNELSI